MARDVARRQFACDCVDFRINGLGTCKHVEATLLHLESRNRRLFSDAFRNGSSRLDVFPDPVTDKLRVSERTGRLPRALRRWWANDGSPCEDSPENVLPALEQLRANGLPELRLSQEIGPWLERRRREAERKQLRHEYERKVQSGEWPAHETEPASLEEALRPPLSHCWKEHLPTLQGYLNDGHQPWQPTLDVLEQV